MYYYAYLYNGIVTTKGMRIRDILFDGELALTEKMFNDLSVPSRLENGAFIPCELPEIEVTEDFDEVLSPIE